MSEQGAASPAFDAADLLDRLDESVTIYDRDARLIFMNQAAVRPFRRPIGELLGKRPWELAPTSAVPSPFRVALEAVLAGAGRTTTTSFATGLRRWYEVDVYPHPLGAFATARDVTEKRRALEELSRSEERFRAIIEFAPEAIVILDTATGKFCDANPEAEKLFGRTRAELLTLRPIDISQPAQPSGADSARIILEKVEQLLNGETIEIEWAAAGAGAQQIAVEVHARRLPSTDPVLIRASIFDITARKRAQEQLAQIQRLEAIARLAGGVAHDFNNMLAVIMGGTELALSGLPPTHAARCDLEDVMGAAERASLITRQLLAFGRQQTAAPCVVDLSAYVERAEPILRRLVGEDVRIVIELERPLSGALIDPAHVEQILLNLAANARDAMPRGGDLTLRTADVLLDRELSGVPAGRYVVLSVTDSGEGIPEAALPHIFEPFFTTKALERGTGLGLATVHGIVKQNKGHIRVQSEPGLGATFTIYLPVVDGQPVAAPPAAEGPTAAVSGSETILLVEDEDRVRAVFRRALQHSGYHVIEASNAGDALLVCEQHPGVIHLMLTDVVMPRMTGPRLAVRLRAERPDLRVIYISGYGEERLDLPEHASTHDGFIAKPVTMEVLLRTVRSALDR